MRTRLWKRSFSLAALAALTIVGLPGQVAAESEPSSPSGVSETCDAQLAAAAARVTVQATAEEEMVPCIEVDQSAASMDIASDPNCPSWGWVVTRFRACTIDDYVLSVYTVRPRTLVGRMYYAIRDDVRTTGKDSRWTHNRQYILKPNWWGAVVGSTVKGYAYCYGDCRDVQTQMPQQAMPPVPGGPLPRAEGVFETTATGTGAIGYADTTWTDWFVNYRWTRPISNSLSTRVPYKLRCDNALPGYGVVGCVFNQVRPIHSISRALPSYHKHIRMALSYNLPRVLTRLTDSFNQTNNRLMSCAPAPSPRPQGFQCDEYPFASTHQGAFTANLPWARTFPGCQLDGLVKFRVDMFGWNICLIPEEENRQGGLNLLGFYNDYRILEREPFEVSAL